MALFEAAVERGVVLECKALPRRGGGGVHTVISTDARPLSEFLEMLRPR